MKTPSVRIAAAAVVAVAIIIAVALSLRSGEDKVVAPPRVETQTVEVPPPVAADPIEREVPEVAEPAMPLRKVQQFPESRITDPAETVWGHVVDAVSKEPIDYFHTYLAPIEAGDIVEVAEKPEYRKVWGNARGAFTLRETPKGRYGLLIRREGYRDFVLRDIEIPNTRGRIDIELARGAYIDVTVVDALGLDGEGGIEVHLKAVALDDPKAKLPAVMLRESDEYGKAVFTGLAPGTWKVFLANGSLSAQGEQQMYVGPDVGVPVQFAIQPLNAVAVTVKDSQGVGLNAVHVRMWSKTGNGTFRAETDTDGEASLLHVPAGTYTVKIWKNGFLRDDREITITTPEGDVPIDFVMAADPLADKGGSELNNLTLEQIQILKTPEGRDVFKKKKP